MTTFTNRKGETDCFDETVVESVEKNAEQYANMHRALPTQIGVDRAQYIQIKKAESAGHAPKITFKGKTIALTVVVAENFANTRARINLNNGTRLAETVTSR